MKKKLSILCSLMIAMQLIFQTAALPVSAADNEVYTVPESPAITYNMNVDWKFTKSAGTTYPLAEAAASVVDANGKQFYEVDYDDSSWEDVSIPHPINAEDSFDGNCYDAGESGLYRGFMFYRKHITVPETDAGKKMFLEFEAVRQSVYLYVNGEIVGFYEAGVAATGFDITDKIKAGEDNVIAVATDNASDRGQSDTTKVTHETKPGSTPGAADGSGYQWNTKDFNEVQGGITGNVNLYVKNDVYQTLPLYNNLKTTGNYIYATDFDIREGKATITVEGEIRNESDSAKNLTLEVAVVENIDPNEDSTDEGADHTKQPYLIASFESDAAAVAPAADKGKVYLSTIPEDAYADEPALTNADTVDVAKITASSAVEGLKFWSPSSPNLYDVYTILKDGDTVIDVQKTTTGFRKVEYDISDGGLKINDTPVWLTGYAQRATNEWAVIGVANDWLEDMDMQWIKESNANFIRWMHVAPKPNAIRSGDKYGVVSAVPAGDKEGDVDGRQWDQRVETMRDVIIYFRNSPSVIFWEAGNASISAEHQQEMTDIKNLLDPNGGRFSGCRSLSGEDQINATEYVGTMLNRYASSAKSAMASASKYVPIMETEYARDEAPRRVWDDFSPPDFDYRNKWLGSGASKQDGYDVWDETSEDFAITDVKSYNEFYSDRVGGSTGNDYYSAAAIMVWSDSNMHNRNTASENCRTSGKVDPVRIKKEAFYAMQAAQSTTPKIHIVGHWNYPQLSDDTYNYPIKEYNGTYWEETGEYGKRDPQNKTVYVVGSPGISKMELYVNDTLVGTSTKPDSTFVFSFPNIDVTQSGKVSAKAYNAREEVIAEDEIATVGDPVTIKLTPVVGPDGLIADGSDIAYFDLAVVDKDGNTCPLSYDKINLSVQGDGVLLGGYNSGVGSNITTHLDYCYAECGTNRIFVRSTRTAGPITLSASFDGQAAVTSTITSIDDLEMSGGLTTKAQRSIEQGEVIQEVKQEVPALKSLASVTTADFGEDGNTYVVSETDLDVHTVKVNGTEVTYKSAPYRPDSTTGVLCDTITTLDALKAAGAGIEYTLYEDGDLPEGYEGKLPYISVTGGLKEDYTSLIIGNASTTLTYTMADGTVERNLLNAEIAWNDGEMISDIASVLGYLDGVTSQLDTENKVLNVTYDNASGNEAAAQLMSDDDNQCVKITATYDDSGALVSVKTETVSISEATDADTDGLTKIMYWDSMTSMKPVTASETAPTAEPILPRDVQPLDVLIDEHTCEESALASLSGANGGGNEMVPVTIEDGAPDGTKYIKTGAVGNNQYGEYCFQDEFTYGSNTKEDIMFSLDIRFDEEYAGFTAEDNGDKKVAGAIVLKNGTIQTQRSSSDYSNSGIAVDTSSWYKIALVGRYSASDANVDMYVWKYAADGTAEYIGMASSISLRNLSASNNSGASHLNISANTSVDNMRVYKLNADTLALDSSDDTINAGDSMLFTSSATRAGAYITNPAVTWAVYNEANDAPLESADVTISESGLLTIAGTAATQVVNVRATADTGIYASKKVNVKAIDTSSDTYDTLELSADKSTVRAGEPITVTAKAYLNGAEVALSDGDVQWHICNAANLRELGNKYITINNGVLSVTEDAVAQNITVRATNKSGSVNGTYAVEVLPANMNYGNENIYTDTYASSDACEEYITGATLEEGSWDGSGYYNVTAAYDFVGFPSNTSADVVYSADMRFANSGAGWTIYNSAKGKLGLQLSTSGTTLNAIGASNKTVGTLEGIDTSAWYNVSVMCKTGTTGYYAVCMVYKYDENGNKVHPKTGKAGEGYELTVALRNLAESTANHININAGTYVDNVLNMYVAPDALDITLDTDEVLAGGSAQATTVASRKGIAFPSLSSDLIKYEIYDADNKYPLGDDKITIDSSGKISVDALASPQDVYVRVLSTSGDMSDSEKLTIKSADIYEVTALGFNEDYSLLKRINVKQNFYYAQDVTFVAVAYNADGTVRNTAMRRTYGDLLNVGANTIGLEMDMTGFDKETGVLKVFVITNASTTAATGPEFTLTSGSGSIGIANTPAFDAQTQVVIMVLKPGADESAVKAEDLAYFDQISAEELAAMTDINVGSGSGEYTVKLGGKINGVDLVSAAKTTL